MQGTMHMKLQIPSGSAMNKSCYRGIKPQVPSYTPSERGQVTWKPDNRLSKAEVFAELSKELKKSV